MHDIAFHIGDFAVHWYGIMLALGFYAGFWTASRRSRRDGIPPETIMDLGPWLIIGGIVGARILYVATYWQESFAGKPLTEIFMIRNGGLVFYGGFIGAVLGCMIHCRRKKISFWKVADVLAPSLALGSAFGRVGCLMTGCCYGRVCTLPWAIHFPQGHETYPNGVHPTQIYDGLMNLMLYGLLAWFYRRKKFDGQIAALYFMCYAVTRSITESFRGDYDAAHQHGGLTPAHLVSIGIFLAGIGIFFLRAGSAKAVGQNQPG